MSARRLLHEFAVIDTAYTVSEDGRRAAGDGRELVDEVRLIGEAHLGRDAGPVWRLCLNQFDGGGANATGAGELLRRQADRKLEASLKLSGAQSDGGGKV